MQLGLGPAIGATFFTIDTNANNGQGTSGQVDTAAQGGATVAGASTISSSRSVAALAALAVVARLVM